MVYRKITNDLTRKISLFKEVIDAIVVILSSTDDGVYLFIEDVVEQARIDLEKVSIESVLTEMVRDGLIDKSKDGTIIGLTRKGRGRAAKIKENLNQEELWQ